MLKFGNSSLSLPENTVEARCKMPMTSKKNLRISKVPFKFLKKKKGKQQSCILKIPLLGSH